MDDHQHNPLNFDRTNGESGADAPGRYEPVPGRDEPVNDEWVSAYLDGEYTADERAEAEARIAASTELRQLADDLRNVRASMDILPQHSLDPAFAERVLRRAEREMLTGDGFQQSAPPGVGPPQHGSSAAAASMPATRERFGGSRPFVWSIAALAAAILILVTNRDAHIRNDGQARRSDAQSVRADKGPARSDNRETDLKSAIRTKAAERENIVAPKTPSLKNADDQARDRLADEQAKPELAPSITLESTARHAGNSLASGVDDQPAQSPSARPALGETIAAPSANQAGAVADHKPLTEAPAEQAPTVASDARSANGTYAFALTASLEPLRVVQVQVERDAWQRREIENVFAQNSIALFDTDSLEQASPDSSQRAQDKVASADSIEEAGRISLAKKEAQSDGMELFVVTAPVAQVEAALEDFQQQKEFRVVQVTDAAAPQQFYEQPIPSLGLPLGGQAYGGVNRAPGGAPISATDNVQKKLDVPDTSEALEAKDSDGAFRAAPNDARAIRMRRAAPPSAPKAATAPPADSDSSSHPEKLTAPTKSAMRAGTTAPENVADNPVAQQQDREQRSPQPTGAQQGIAARRFAAPQAGAGLGGGGFSAQNDRTPGYGRGHAIGGNDGYGAAGNIADGVANPQPFDAVQADLAVGYGQRVTLQPAPTVNSTEVTNNYSRGAVRPGRAAASPLENNLAATNTPERVLFLFRIVDTPLTSDSVGGSVGGGSAVGGSATAESSPAPATEPSADTKGNQKADVVPAPAPPGGPPR